MQRSKSLTRYFLIVAGLAVMLFPSFASAEPHPEVTKNKVTGVPTYRNSGYIGNMIFTEQPTKPHVKEYNEGILDRLEFRRGTSPDFYGRRFYHCTVKEAIGYIKKKQPTASAFKLQTNMKIQDKRGNIVAEETTVADASDMLSPGWNTTHFEGKLRLGKQLSMLRVGNYTLYVDTYLTYEYIPHKLMGKKEPSNILLAAGKLPLSVK
ncbi:MAG: hypothetical protein JW902_05965 [Syntrophaceae bacterium]|nr:hypothetical protein [Syntrophaceae bacterium]